MSINYMTQQQINRIINACQLTQYLPCQDQICGQFNNGQFTPCQRIDVDYLNGLAYESTTGNLLKKTVVIVLESPHKSEYHNNIPQGPARGNTGKLFNNKINSLIQGSRIYPSINNGTYDVLFINSVQFQCSLGNRLTTSTNKNTRDKNWLDIFYNFNGSGDLSNRIMSLNPIAVINLCTMENVNLQLHVDRVLNSQNYNYTIGTHPCTWNFSYANIQ